MNSSQLADMLTQDHRDIDELFLKAMGEELASRELSERAFQALKAHIYFEEASLFPPLQRGGLAGAIFVMLREHGEMWTMMAEIEGAIEAGKAEEANAGLKELMALLARHNHKEEPIVYTGMQGKFDEDLEKELLEGFEEGTLPEGWHCKRYRPE